jgi:mono/diheme cytochrome c family protein
MRATKTAGAVVCLAMAVSGGLAAASDIGKSEYDANCVACHGVDGKGGGVFSEMLKSPVPDLTTLAKKNGGVFPAARVYGVIDGREEVRAHGSRDMPIWGTDYQGAGRPAHDDYPFNAEFFVRARILALIDYLYRLQAK